MREWVNEREATSTKWRISTYRIFICWCIHFPIFIFRFSFLPLIWTFICIFDVKIEDIFKIKPLRKTSGSIRRNFNDLNGNFCLFLFNCLLKHTQKRLIDFLILVFSISFMIMFSNGRFRFFFSSVAIISMHSHDDHQIGWQWHE